MRGWHQRGGMREEELLLKSWSLNTKKMILFSVACRWSHDGGTRGPIPESGGKCGKCDARWSRDNSASQSDPAQHLRQSYHLLLLLIFQSLKLCDLSLSVGFLILSFDPGSNVTQHNKSIMIQTCNYKHGGLPHTLSFMISEIENVLLTFCGMINILILNN